MVFISPKEFILLLISLINIAVARLIDNEEIDIAYGAKNGEEPTHILIYFRNKGDICGCWS